MNNPIIESYLLRHEHFLQNLISKSDIPSGLIKEAITYALFPGGKRLRPLLVYLCGELLDIKLATLDVIAAAVEITHCYSLVHDDLPAMDNDDMRRGKASCHRAYDEATAILVGDGMQALAIDALLSELPSTLTPIQVIAVTLELVKASGPSGMVSGQSLDLLKLSNLTVSELELREIHLLKTGRLILACITMVLAASNPTPSAIDSLNGFANTLGLVFQMQDDFLDEYGVENLGKGRSSDKANNKTTFARIYSKSDLLSLIETSYQNMIESLNHFGTSAHNLIHLVQSLQFRTNH